ncbi:MAG: nucleotidyl transferase AbiEii/AbiGii toxin family protein, partial [Phycisphaerales bacterium JB058]
MDKVARFAPRDRSDLFRAAAEAKGVSVQIIEKDFWVCWVLRQLYTLGGLPAPIYFKGGTSLSKAFGVIDRMSEDIDLVIDREALGFTGDRDPSAEELSNKARNRLIDELKQVAANYVHGTLHPALRERFRDRLPDEPGWSLDANVENRFVLCGFVIGIACHGIDPRSILTGTAGRQATERLANQLGLLVG